MGITSPINHLYAASDRGEPSRTPPEALLRDCRLGKTKCHAAYRRDPSVVIVTAVVVAPVVLIECVVVVMFGRNTGEIGGVRG